MKLFKTILNFYFREKYVVFLMTLFLTIFRFSLCLLRRVLEWTKCSFLRKVIPTQNVHLNQVLSCSGNIILEFKVYPFSTQLTGFFCIITRSWK